MLEAEASPTPAHTPQFATAFRGYDQLKVDEYVAKLKAELAATAQHRDEATSSVAELSKALSYAQNELVEAKSALARMAEDPAGAAAMSERVKTMMKLAEEEIAEMRAKAEQDAAGIRDAADAYADKTRQKAEAVAEQLDREAAEKRAAADRKAQEEIAAKRAAAEKAAAEREAAAKQKAESLLADAKQRSESMLADAKQRSESMLADAEQQLSEARSKRKQALELRATVADRLASTNTALQQALERLGPDPETTAVKAK